MNGPMRTPPMQDAALIEALSNATSLELYQLAALVERLMSDGAWGVPVFRRRAQTRGAGRSISPSRWPRSTLRRSAPARPCALHAPSRKQRLATGRVLRPALVPDPAPPWRLPSRTTRFRRELNDRRSATGARTGDLGQIPSANPASRVGCGAPRPCPAKGCKSIARTGCHARYSASHSGQASRRHIAEGSKTLKQHVSAVEAPFVILLEHHGADEPSDGLVVGRDADDVGRTSSVTRSMR